MFAALLGQPFGLLPLVFGVADVFVSRLGGLFKLGLPFNQEGGQPVALLGELINVVEPLLRDARLFATLLGQPFGLLPLFLGVADVFVPRLGGLFKLGLPFNQKGGQPVALLGELVNVVKPLLREAHLFAALLGKLLRLLSALRQFWAERCFPILNIEYPANGRMPLFFKGEAAETTGGKKGINFRLVGSAAGQ